MDLNIFFRLMKKMRKTLEIDVYGQSKDILNSSTGAKMNDKFIDEIYPILDALVTFYLSSYIL